MRAEIAVRALLMQASAVTSHVGDRCYPVRLPIDVALPALITEHLSTSLPVRLVAPVVGDAPGAERSRISVHVVAETYPSVQQVLAAIRTALHGYRGTAGGVQVGHIGADLVGPALCDDEQTSWTQSIDLMVVTYP